MIYNIRKLGTGNGRFSGRIRTWDGVVTDAAPDSMYGFVGEAIEHVLPKLKLQGMVWDVKPHPAGERK